MGDIDRILGRLEEFKRSSEKRFDTIEKKLDALHVHKWKIARGAAILGVIIGSVGNVVVKLLK